MAINILQELNLGAAKASFSRDEVETLADIKKLDVAQKYPNNYDIFCKEDGCKYRLNKTSHSTMQDNLPHPTGKWRRVDSVISSSMPAPITVGDVVLYLGPTVMDQVDHSKVKFQTGKYYRTEYTKVNKQMYAFVQNTAPDVPDTSPNPAVIWFSETSTLSEGSVLFTPVNGSIFDNKEHGIIMTSDWDGQSAISGSSYEYLDNSNNAKLGIVRNSNFDITFDSFPELTWNMFDTEAELENIKQNVIPEAISSATEEIKTEVKEEVKEDVDANLGQAKKLNDILTDGDIKLLKQGGTEKLVSSKPDATVSDSTIGFVQCDCNRNEETGEVTLNITNVKYGPFTEEEIAENVFVDEDGIIVPSGITGLPIYAITCSVTNKAKDAIFCALKDSNLYKGTLSFDAMSFLPKMEEGLPIVIGFAAAAPYKDEEHSGSVDSNTYVSLYNLLEIIAYGGNPAFTPVPVSEIPDIKSRAVELLEKETVLDLILFVACYEGLESQLASSNILDTFNEQFVIGTEASGILNEFPTMRKEIEDSITEEFSNVKKLNDSLNEEDVDTIISRPRESLFDVKSPYIPYGNKLLTECTFVKLEFDDNGVATITDSATVSDALSLPGAPYEWVNDDNRFAILFGIMQSDSYVGYQRTAADIYNCSFKVDYESPDIDISRKPENMFGIDSVYFAVGNNGDEWGEIEADFTACKFTDIDTYAPGTEDVDGRHLFGDLIGDYEENGTPITLRDYSKSNYTVLYGIALFEASGNVISESDYTSKNITASINKRVVPAYQESGLLVDFPKIEEQIAAVKTMADEFDTVKQNANKAIELALPAETKDYIDENIFDSNKTFSELNPSYYQYTTTDYTGFVSLGTTSYDHTAKNRSIAPVFKNYFDKSKEDYVSSEEVLTANSSTNDRYAGFLCSVAYVSDGFDEFVKSLQGMAMIFDSSKSIAIDGVNYKIVDAYVKTIQDSRSYDTNYADQISSNGWIRVDSIVDLSEAVKNARQYYSTDKHCWLDAIVVIDAFSSNTPIADLTLFSTNKTNILSQLFSLVKIPIETKIDTINRKIDSLGAGRGIEYFNQNIFSTKDFDLANTAAYNNTNFTHLVALGTLGEYTLIYDHTDPERAVAPKFYNYFDSSTSSVTTGIFSHREGYSYCDSYIGLLGVLDYSDNTENPGVFETRFKNLIAKFDPNKKYYHPLTDGYSTKEFRIVDVYINIAQSDLAENVPSEGWYRIESGEDIGEAFKNVTDISGTRYAEILIVLDAMNWRAYNGSYDRITDASYIYQYQIDGVLANIFDLAFSKLETRLNEIESSIIGGDAVENLIDTKLSVATEEIKTDTKAEIIEENIKPLSDATKSIIQKYPIKIATSSDSGFNGALKINADTYDPETTTSVSLSFYNYYDSSKSNYRNPANPATPMLVEDKFVAIPTFIDIAEVLGIPSFTSASQLKEYCKNISVRFDRNQSIKVDLQNNNNTNVYSGANVFIRDIYFRTYSTAQAPAQAATYNTKITNSDPIADLIDASSSTGFIPIFIFILEVIPDVNYSVPLKNYLAQQNFAKFINSLCEISFNKVRDAEDKANKVQEAIENMPSITDDISALESKVAKCSKLTDRFTDAEMDKLFKKITEKIISSVNGVNDVDFRICACTSSDNWETATITKYMEAPLSGDLTDYHISLPGAYGDTFDTIAVSCGISFTNGNSATGLPYYEVINNKAINTWLNAYLLDPVAIYTAQTSSSSSFDKSTYYKTRVKDGGPSDSTIKYSDMEPLKSNAYEWSSRIHFLVFIQVNSNTTAEDLNAADLFELAKKAIVPVGTTSGIVSEFDTVKQNANSAKDMADEFETVKQNANSAIELAIPKETKEYIKNKLHDIRTVSLREATTSASQGIAYDITNCNGLISIGSSYDDQDESRSISVAFKNYFDSSKSDYVSASEVIAIKDAAEWYQRTNYIAIPVVIGDRCGDKESILEQLKGVFATKSSSAYLIKKKTSYGARPYGKLVDVYGGITSDSSGSAKLNQLSFSSLSRTDESTFSVAELLSDAVIGSDYYQTPCLILVYDVYYSDSPEISSDTIIELDTEDLVKNTFNMYAIPIENRVNQLEQKFDGIETAVSSISSVTDSVDNISDSMSDYMSAKWLPTPIAFPDEALENEQEPSGNSKNYDFLLYPTFVDVPHSTGSSVEGKKSRYSVKPIPESGENTTVKALYESEDSMYLLFGFFGEKLLPESLGGDYTIPETYSENTIESFNRVSKTLWYSDIYLNMQNTFSYSMIKGIRDSLLEIDVSNIFLNFNPRVIKSLYAKVTADPGNELTYSTYTNRGLNNMEDFVKIPYANIQDINTISMEDIVNMCGRPDKTKSSGSSKAVVLFIAEINKSSFPGLASLTTPAYGVSNTTSDILAIYQAMFANNSESSPIYMARSINDSLKKTKEVAVEAARYAAATLTAAKHYDTLSDLKRLISEGESGYIVRNGETEGTSVADVYIKTTEGALIKIASGVEYEAPIS